MPDDSYGGLSFVSPLGRPEKRPAEDELRGRVEEALTRARSIADGAPLAGGQQRLLDYIIAECDTRASQIDQSGLSSRPLREFLEFLGNLRDFIGEA